MGSNEQYFQNHPAQRPSSYGTPRISQAAGQTVPSTNNPAPSSNNGNIAQPGQYYTPVVPATPAPPVVAVVSRPYTPVASPQPFTPVNQFYTPVNGGGAGSSYGGGSNTIRQPVLSTKTSTYTSAEAAQSAAESEIAKRSTSGNQATVFGAKKYVYDTPTGQGILTINESVGTDAIVASSARGGLLTASGIRVINPIENNPNIPYYAERTKNDLTTKGYRPVASLSSGETLVVAPSAPNIVNRSATFKELVQSYKTQEEANRFVSPEIFPKDMSVSDVGLIPLRAVGAGFTSFDKFVTERDNAAGGLTFSGFKDFTESGSSLAKALNQRYVQETKAPSVVKFGGGVLTGAASAGESILSSPSTYATLGVGAVIGGSSASSGLAVKEVQVAGRSQELLPGFEKFTLPEIRNPLATYESLAPTSKTVLVSGVTKGTKIASTIGKVAEAGFYGSVALNVYDQASKGSGTPGDIGTAFGSGIGLLGAAIIGKEVVTGFSQKYVPINQNTLQESVLYEGKGNVVPLFDEPNRFVTTTTRSASPEGGVDINLKYNPVIKDVIPSAQKTLNVGKVNTGFRLPGTPYNFEETTIGVGGNAKIAPKVVDVSKNELYYIDVSKRTIPSGRMTSVLPSGQTDYFGDVIVKNQVDFTKVPQKDIVGVQQSLIEQKPNVSFLGNKRGSFGGNTRGSGYGQSLIFEDSKVIEGLVTKQTYTPESSVRSVRVSSVQLARPQVNTIPIVSQRFGGVQNSVMNQVLKSQQARNAGLKINNVQSTRPIVLQQQTPSIKSVQLPATQLRSSQLVNQVQAQALKNNLLQTGTTRTTALGLFLNTPKPFINTPTVFTLPPLGGDSKGGFFPVRTKKKKAKYAPSFTDIFFNKTVSGKKADNLINSKGGSISNLLGNRPVIKSTSRKKLFK